LPTKGPRNKLDGHTMTALKCLTVINWMVTRWLPWSVWL